MGALLDHSAVSLCTLSNSPSKIVRNTPACIVLTQVLHLICIIHTLEIVSANRHLHGHGERNGTQRRTKVSFGRTIMQALEQLRLVKMHISG